MLGLRPTLAACWRLRLQGPQHDGLHSTISSTSATWEEPTNPPASQTFIVKNIRAGSQTVQLRMGTRWTRPSAPATRLVDQRGLPLLVPGQGVHDGINGSGSAFWRHPAEWRELQRDRRARFINNVQDWPHGPVLVSRMASDAVVVLDLVTNNPTSTFTTGG